MKNMRLTVCIGIMCGWLAAGMLHAGTRPDHVPVLLEKKKTGRGDGFAITSSEHQVRILSSTETGLLYGAYSLLRMQAAGQLTVPLSVTEQPAYDLRILNHWDNPDGTVERGYAGRSLWNWEELPGTLSPRFCGY